MVVKSKRLSARLAEWVKLRTPNWSWLHAVLDGLVGVAVGWLWAFALFLSGAVTTCLKAAFATMGGWSQLLLVVFITGAVVSGVQLRAQAKQIRPCSKKERRLAELIEQAEEVKSVDQGTIWMDAVSNFLVMDGFSEWYRRFDELRQKIAEKDFECDGASTEDIARFVKEGTEILKNYEATCDHGTSPA